MEITLEMVERLKEKADVSYAQAKEALEYSGGNLLDALIYLEEKGAAPRQAEAYFSTKGAAPAPMLPEEPASRAAPPKDKREKKAKKQGTPVVKAPKKSGGSFLATLRRWLIDNELEVWRKGQPITGLPVLILLLLLCFAYWFTIPALVLGLFTGFRYRFSGPDLEREELNSMMGSVADTAADLGQKVMEELKHDWHSDEAGHKVEDGKPER